MVIVQTSQNTHLFAFVVITAVTCRLLIRIEIRIMVDSFFLKRFYFISDTILNPFHFAGNQTVHRGHLPKQRFFFFGKRRLYARKHLLPFLRKCRNAADKTVAFRGVLQCGVHVLRFVIQRKDISVHQARPPAPWLFFRSLCMACFHVSRNSVTSFSASSKTLRYSARSRRSAGGGCNHKWMTSARKSQSPGLT